MQKGNTLIFLLIGILIIAVAGGVYYLKFKKPESFEQRLSRQNPVIIPSIPPQQNNKPTPDTKPQNDETDNWKAYTNVEQHYSLLYPAGWNVNVSRNPQTGQVYSTAFSPESFTIKGPSPFISVRTISNPSDNSITDYLINQTGVEKNFRYTLISIDGHQGIRTSEVPSRATNEFVFLKNRTLIYEISITDNSRGEIPLTTFNQILSTFKFTQ